MGGSVKRERKISLGGGFREIGVVVYEKRTQPWLGAETATELCTRCKCWSYCPVPAARSIHLSASLKIPLMRDEICIRSHFE